MTQLSQDADVGLRYHKLFLIWSVGADVGLETTLEQLPGHSFGRIFLWGRSLGLREQPAFRIDVRRTPQRAVPRTAMARYEPYQQMSCRPSCHT